MAADLRQRVEPHGDEISGLFAGQVLGGHHHAAPRALKLFQPAPDQLDRAQLREHLLIGTAAKPRALTTQQPDRVGPGLLDEPEQHFGRNRHAGFVVVPRPRREVQATGQLRSAMVPEDLLANFSQTARERRLDVYTNFRSLLSSHGATIPHAGTPRRSDRRVRLLRFDASCDQSISSTGCRSRVPRPAVSHSVQNRARTHALKKTRYQKKPPASSMRPEMCAKMQILSRNGNIRSSAFAYQSRSPQRSPTHRCLLKMATARTTPQAEFEWPKGDLKKAMDTRHPASQPEHRPGNRRHPGSSSVLELRQPWKGATNQPRALALGSGTSVLNSREP